MNPKSHHIVVSEINFEKLKLLGNKGDSFDNIISKLLEVQKNDF
ncbi:hypothetical protein [Nitrosopumilus adriaticus]|nr:hypothetical protein [Nitrosopumilus adriaticus]